jgi:hypothetical protein
MLLIGGGIATVCGTIAMSLFNTSTEEEEVRSFFEAGKPHGYASPPIIFGFGFLGFWIFESPNLTSAAG